MELRRSTKLVWAALGVALVLNAAGVSAAQAGNAPRWKIEGAFLAEKATEKFTATSTETTRLNVPGVGLTIESPNGKCTMSGEIVGSNAFFPGFKKGVALICTGTTVKGGGAECDVTSPGKAKGEIVYKTMAGLLVWRASTGESAGDNLYAETAGGPLAEFEIKGKTCPVSPGTFSLKGELIGSILPVAGEKTAISETFQEPAIEKWWNNATPREEKTIAQLTFAGLNATLQGSFSEGLSKGEKFGVFGG
jgi:hypothetical protein